MTLDHHQDPSLLLMPEPLANAPVNSARQAGKRRPKRVGRACESCRQKRLKCTESAQPCMNCILYAAECVYSTASSLRRGPNPRKKGVAKAYRPSVPRGLSTGQQNVTQEEIASQPERHADPGHSGSPNATSATNGAEGHAAESMQLGLSPNLSQSPSMRQAFPLSIGFTSALNFEDLGRMTDLFDEGPFPQYTPEPVPHVPCGVATSEPSCSASYDAARRESISGSVGEHPGERVVGLNYFQLDAVPDVDQGSPVGLMIWKNAECNKFIGPASTGAIISSCLKQSIQSFGRIKESHALDYLIGAVEHVDEISVPSNPEPSDYWLPEQEFATCSIDAYFRNVHVLYPIFDRERFENEWPHLYDRSSGSCDRIFLSSFYLIVAIGAVSENVGFNSNAQNESLSKDLYHRAWIMFEDAIARPYTSSVQVLILHVIYLFHYSKSGIAWVLCGLAVRMAQSLGLHRADRDDPSLNAANMRLRTQIWWTCYILDAFLSATQGRPPAAHDSSCNDNTLFRISNSSPSDGGHSLAFSIFIWHVGLARIKNRLCHLFSSQEPGRPLAHEVSELDAALTSWRDEIPMEYRPEQEILAPREFYPFISMLHLHYFNMMSSMHWALSTSVEGGSSILNVHHNPRIRTSEAISVSSARSFIKILNDISDELGGKKLPPICLHTDHYMSAISIIFANIFKDSKKMSARTDLEFLRAGHHHFERHVNPLRFNARIRTLFQTMQAAAEEVLETHGKVYRPPEFNESLPYNVEK